MNEALQRAGYRPMPEGEAQEDEILSPWEAEGGLWQFVCPRYQLPDILYRGDWIEWRGHGAWCRPVNAVTGDYDPAGWNEPIVPAEPGWWLWDADDGRRMIFRIDIPSIGPQALFAWGPEPVEDYDLDLSAYVERFCVINGGRWIGPCRKPGCKP